MLLADGTIQISLEFCVILCAPTHVAITEYSISAQFDDGDLAYEWIVLFLVCCPFYCFLSLICESFQTQENVWRKSRNFHVTAKSSKRKYGIDSGLDPRVEGNADYVPTYGPPHIFRWKGYWVEIKKETGNQTIVPYGMYSTNSLYLT
jgi:chaperone BCS1